jgi:hypothetical protein
VPATENPLLPRTPTRRRSAPWPGGKVQFPAATCQPRPLRERCATTAHGRSVQIHPDGRPHPGRPPAGRPPGSSPPAGRCRRSRPARRPSPRPRPAPPARWPGLGHGRHIVPVAVQGRLEAGGAQNADEAAAATAALGHPVVLSATAEPLRHRPQLGTVRLDIVAEVELRAADQAMAARLDGPTAGLAVQAKAPPGVATVVRTAEDPSFGALISFGVSGVATDLLGDRAVRVLPLTDLDAAELVRAVPRRPAAGRVPGQRAGGRRRAGAAAPAAARWADDLPEVAELELNPVIVSASGTSVLRATARVAAPTVRLDAGPRRVG